MSWQMSRFRTGDWVVVRGPQEILATLDERSCLDGLPFMPEMLAFCGRRLRVAAVAHKTCDPAHKTGGRRLDRAVHLEASRCDGSAHGGCQAECNLFWKDAWLAPAPSTPAGAADAQDSAARVASRLRTGEGGRYSCQATELIHATRYLPWWNVRQYFLDVVSRNHSVGVVLKVVVLAGLRGLLALPGYRIWRRVSDRMHRILTGRKAPIVAGRVPPGGKTPTGTLGLAPGERVLVRDLAQIEATLDRNSKNRGMWFDAEQVAYCGHSYEVRRPVTRIIDERTGELIELKNPCIVLEGVLCSGHFSSGRLLCPRAITPYWREVWLERTGS